MIKMLKLKSKCIFQLGLIWLAQWGPARYAMNAAFLMLKVSEMESVPDNIRSQVAAVAIDQANYLLGTNS